jgi:acetylglutamate kinase
MKEKISIVKIGGNVIEDEAQLDKFVNAFAALGGLKILVHGGGKLATQLAEKLGVETQMVNGRRITNAESLKIITMVYAGLANKNIVAKLQALNCNAIGLSGADANMILAHKRPIKEIDFGFVGDIDKVNSKNVERLITSGMTPVFCAISHDGNGQLLNTNADTIAAELAIAMSEFYESILYYCFEKKGVLENIENEDSVIKHINRSTYEELVEKEVIVAGMLPKMHNCFHALDNRVKKVCVGDLSMISSINATFTTLTL